MSDLEELFQSFAGLPYHTPVTPYRVAVFVLVQTCKENETELNSNEKCQSALLAVDLMRQMDLTLLELCDRIRSRASSELLKSYIDHIKDSMDAEEVLCKSDDVFSGPPEPKFQPFVKKDSLLGLYLRKLIISYQKVSFTEVGIFHSKWLEYCSQLNDDSFDVSANSFNQTGSSSTGDLNLCTPFSATYKYSPLKDKHNSDLALTQDSRRLKSVSGRQALRLVAKQLHLLQTNPQEALSPIEMENAIKNIQKTLPDLYEVSFLSYLNAIRVSDLCEAESAIHDYFDWSCMSLQYKRNDNAPAHLSKSLRYAPLLLAKLYRRFGLYAKALRSLQESVQKSQEAADAVCLQHALAELCSLSKSCDFDDASDLLNLALHEPINREQANGGSDHDSNEQNREALNSLQQRAKFQNALLNLSNGSLTCNELSDSISACTVVTDCDHSHRISEAAEALLSSMYLSFGHRESSLQSAQQLLKANVGDWWCSSKTTEPYCIAMCNTAYVHAIEGDMDSASKVLEHCRSLFPDHLHVSRHWKLCRAVLSFEREFMRANLIGARDAVETIRGFDKTEAEIRDALLLLVCGHLDLALHLIQKRLEYLKDREHWRNRCRLLILLGAVFYKLESTGSASECLEQCQTIARSHHAAHIHACAQIYLAAVQLKQGQPEKALKSLESCRETLSKRCSLIDYAISLRLRAQCLWKMKTESEEVVKNLQEAEGICQKLEVHWVQKQVVYLLAIFYNEQANFNERNACAARFKHLEQCCPAGVENWTLI